MAKKLKKKFIEYKEAVLSSSRFKFLFWKLNIENNFLEVRNLEVRNWNLYEFSIRLGTLPMHNLFLEQYSHYYEQNEYDLSYLDNCDIFVGIILQHHVKSGPFLFL